ncbi:DDRGK domain-containing protein 1 [Leguminivora glycinivorella]|uniref:DDRGK domain-containing protein 1 n=1 Tax=Leguminivora glycinivorella TaxID=1035111 RepID=UPI00200F3B33|nr:DDRGK domain-containing protein 1 [Leguminivora glycinivorella]
MDPFIIAAILSAIVIIVLSVAFLRVVKVKPQPGGARPVPQREGGPGRVQAVRNQRARMRANAARNQAALEEDEPAVADEEHDEGQDGQRVDFDDKMGAKKRAKLEAKLEKKKAREAEEQMREIKKKKNEELEEERKKIEEKQEEEQERESLLKDFVDHIKSQKVVLLEDLAAHFRLKTQAAIDRITDLQASGELTGVIDDRGKFIYISQKELEDVAKFIKQRGRVSITELAESSNDLINLNPVPLST